MRILHVVPAYYPAHQYGGPIESVHQLCRHLLELGCGLRVLTTDADGPNVLAGVAKNRTVDGPAGVRVRYCRRVAGESISPALLRSLPECVRWAEVVHLTAVYSFPTIPTLMACKALAKPTVWSPRGALQRGPGTTRRGLKAVWERICQWVAPERLVLHATSDEEARQSAARLPGTRLAVVPNGVEVPRSTGSHHASPDFRILFIGRLHPGKGLETLLTACAALGDSIGGWKLTVAGSGENGYVARVIDLARARGVASRVEFVGWVEGEAKVSLFENTDVTILPSERENFGMVVAESLAYGVPVIAGRGTPWKRVEEVGCGLWVRDDAQSLAEAIRRVRGMPLHEMGKRGRDWMRSEFGWPGVASRMIEVYRDLLVPQ